MKISKWNIVLLICAGLNLAVLFYSYSQGRYGAACLAALLVGVLTTQAIYGELLDKESKLSKKCLEEWHIALNRWGESLDREETLAEINRTLLDNSHAMAIELNEARTELKTYEERKIDDGK